MHKILPETEGDFVAIEVLDKLEELDFEILAPLLQAKIEEYNKIALFVEMRDFHGWTSGGLWADTKFDLKHHGDFSRIAMVGDKKWEEWMATLTKPFTSAAVRYFEISDREIALRWASGGRLHPVHA
ncbi:STAS/SEC14 domain-containing protein [Coraliomargarita parva]|uniref:STAS/SEC14 domain-containing protein n=1 Tax=Coraliomargarita parva TaxID=3014050 RepID=UPI0022B5E372|nr:STAS/SEC14 domain-containing protein [Coraliomargarita parva]